MRILNHTVGGLILSAASIHIVGCNTVPQEAGFPEVQQHIADRTSQRVHWRRGGEEDAAVDKAVQEILSKPMTPEDAVQVALLNNRKLQATYEDLMVAQADLVQAGLLRNPIFDAAFRLDSGSTAGIELSVVQDFLQVFQIPLRKRIAGSRFEAVKLEVTAEVLDTSRDVRRGAIDLIAAVQLVELRQSVHDATSASYELAQKLHEAGNTTDLALAMQRAQYEQAKLDLADAQAQVTQQRERMNGMLGLWGPSADNWSMIERLPEPVADQSDSPTPDDLLTKAIDNSLALGATRHRMQSLADQLGLEKSQRLLPGFEAGAVGERDAGESDWLVGPVIAMPIPLFDQGQGEVAKATAEVRRIQAQYYDQAVQVRAALRAAFARLESSKAKVDYYKQVMLPLHQQIVDQTQLQYNAMQIGGFQLLQAKQTQIETGTRYLDALTEYWRNHAELTAIVNGGSAELEMKMTNTSSSAPVTDGAGGH